MSSSSSSKPLGSSSSPSSSKPSSSFSSSSTPKPSSPQSVPTISANAWMSFFLFCCLVLIILQGPLGLTGGGALPGVAQWAQWPNFGGEWWTGWGGLGSGLGLGGAPGQLPGQAREWEAKVVSQHLKVVADGVVSNQPYIHTISPQPSQYRCTIYQPWFCVPTFAYAQSYPPGGVGSVYEPPRAYAYRYRQPYSYVHPHRHYQNGQHHLTHPERHAYGDATAYEYQYQQTGTGRNIQAQVQGQGGQPIRAVHPPPQQAVPCPPPAVPVHPPISVTPDSLGGLANLENAFYPLLVGAIALLVIFDYMS
ncbi:hypothetical protein L804_01728 [Cryptococcus deuterogattii 2001/935-1]|nr:hypothetical protein L804_01728 [Cryptococcus deuterogattii 2001/935-1]